MEKTNFCVMLDVSRNGVIKVDKVKEYIDYLQKIGYKSLMLYTEDTYEVEGEKAFGYLRGAYTVTELKQIDDYAFSKGIELIPCIQTLAHLNCIFRYPEYEEIRDTNDILLIGEDRTYALIENMFKTITKAFRSKTVHIGLDEADLVGRGKYANLHGFRNITELMNEHLSKVAEIAQKYGLNTLMWSDMFVRFENNGKYYAENPVSKAVVKAMPKNVTPVYWDYYHTTEEEYEKYFALHDNFDNVWFAGGTWSWLGFAPNLKFALKSTRASMEVCRRRGVKDIIMTVWGDNGRECSCFTALPILFYAKCIYEGKSDMAQIKQEFNALTGEDFDSFILLDLPNECNKDDEEMSMMSKYMLYNDPFFGVYDVRVVGNEREFYNNAAVLFETASKKSKSFGYIFEFEKDLCKALSYKYGLGAQTRKAYQSKDKKQIKNVLKDYESAIKAIRKFYKSFQKVWEIENKPNGFEVQIIRMGGLIERLEFCKDKLKGYLCGKIDIIEELENELIDVYDLNGKNKGYVYNDWKTNVTVNVM